MMALGSELSIWARSAKASLLKTWLLAREDQKLPLRVTLFRPSRSVSEAYFSGPEVMLLLEDPEDNAKPAIDLVRSEEHTSELQSRQYLVCRLLLEKKK